MKELLLSRLFMVLTYPLKSLTECTPPTNKELDHLRPETQSSLFLVLLHLLGVGMLILLVRLNWPIWMKIIGLFGVVLPMFIGGLAMQKSISGKIKDRDG